MLPWLFSKLYSWLSQEQQAKWHTNIGFSPITALISLLLKIGKKQSLGIFERNRLPCVFSKSYGWLSQEKLKANFPGCYPKIYEEPQHRHQIALHRWTRLETRRLAIRSVFRTTPSTPRKVYLSAGRKNEHVGADGI